MPGEGKKRTKLPRYVEDLIIPSREEVKLFVANAQTMAVKRVDDDRIARCAAYAQVTAETFKEFKLSLDEAVTALVSAAWMLLEEECRRTAQ